MRAKIFIFNLLMFKAINAFLQLNPNEYTECETDETISYSCESMDNCVIKDIIPTQNLKSAFDLAKISYGTRNKYNISLQYLNDHFKIYLSEDTLVNRNDFSPALLKLLNKIPQNIMIKGGIIHTKGKSLISGIGVKNLSNYSQNAISPPGTINTNKFFTDRPLCYIKNNPNNYFLPKNNYITMDRIYVSVTYKCNSGIIREYFRVSQEYNLQNTVEVNDMTCFLQSNKKKETDKYNYKRNTTGKGFSGLHFELYFSYTCRFFVQTSVPHVRFINFANMPVYISYRFTISGYHLNSHQIIDLTYLVIQRPINNEIFPEE
ncbi:uncharacterized protein LOC142317365 isoform X2 [Lycorma delicatula]|uniref:uncharacterized protein LOC142317365 isoform X2 n=1 Tax=Lycorma delicatula TaxID=130591 RepID=UPI003F50DDC8